MGIGFVIIFHLLFLTIVSTIMGITIGLTTYFKDKSRSVLNSLIKSGIPFVFLFSLYFLILIGATIISIYKNVDIGIGDSWKVPLNNKCDLNFIDLPEQASIYCGKESLVNDISHLKQDKDKIYGKTYEDEFFSYNLTTSILKKYKSETEFISNETENPKTFFTAMKFYSERKNEICGTETNIMGILSLMLSILITILYFKLTMKIIKWITKN